MRWRRQRKRSGCQQASVIYLLQLPRHTQTVRKIRRICKLVGPKLQIITCHTATETTASTRIETENRSVWEKFEGLTVFFWPSPSIILSQWRGQSTVKLLLGEFFNLLQRFSTENSSAEFTTRRFLMAQQDLNPSYGKLSTIKCITYSLLIAPSLGCSLWHSPTAACFKRSIKNYLQRLTCDIWF